jgi:hypothetical protein
VAVEYSDPKIAYKMAKEVVNELLQENEKVIIAGQAGLKDNVKVKDVTTVQ